ncbi:toll-like receptor Tollo [Amblyomma americanum]
MRGVCSWAHCITEGDLDAEKVFDVFLSFSSKDAGWVHEQLIPGLEAVALSYCTYERNFKGGFLLQDIIRDAVACSRRTVLLLTRNFVTSEWCRWEFRLAHQKALEDNVNRLIIVLVGEVGSSSLDEDLRLYMRAANYIRWGQPNFWERFYCSMARKSAKRKLIIRESLQPTLA